MRTMTIASLIALASLGAVGAVAAASHYTERGSLNAAGNSERQWLSIPEIHARLEAAGYRNIEKIEREHGNYEAKATDRHGERVKLHLNPRTGEVIDARARESERARGERGDKSDARAAASAYSSGLGAPDCNKRRCRDDLPQPASATPPAGK